MQSIRQKQGVGLEADEATHDTTARRFLGIFVAPRSTLADIVRRPSYLAPLLVALIASLSAGYVYARWVVTDVTIEQAARAAISSSAGLEGTDAQSLEDRVQQRVATMSKVRRLWPLGTTAELALVVVGVTTLFFLSLRLLRGQPSFKPMLSVTSWSWMVWSLVFAAGAWTTLALRDPTSLDPTDPYVLSFASLARLLPALRPDSPLYSLAANFSLQNLWFLGLLAIGYSAAEQKLSPTKVTAVVVGLGLVVFLGRALLGL